MTDRLLHRYLPLIDDPQAFQAALDRPLPVCIWVNPLKSTRPSVHRALVDSGLGLEPVTWYPGAFRSYAWPKPGETLPYVAGGYCIQEEIALSAVAALDPQPGDRVLDLCAAPGGKTAQIAVRLDGQGMVIANERNLGRLSSLQSTIGRLGLLNVVMTWGDGRSLLLPPDSMDRVLVDAPCSGEGTVRKKHQQNRETFYHWRADLSQRHAAIQRSLLDRALHLVKPGGVVVYSTCTYAPEENEAVIDAVLGDRGHLEPLPLAGLRSAPGLLTWQGQYFRSDMPNAQRFFPHLNDTGGFFVARIRRTESPVDAVGLRHAPPLQPLPPDAAAEQAMAWFGDRFGLGPVGSQFTPWRSGKTNLFMAHQDCQLPPRLQIQTVGLPFLRLGSGEPKPTTFALQRLGQSITQHVVELDAHEAQLFLEGRDQTLSGAHGRGYVHVRHQDFELGCGFLRGPHLQSQLPKSLRLRGKKDIPAQKLDDED